MPGRPPESPAVAWRKSRHSTSGNDCVEVAGLAVAGVAVRDSKDPAGPVLTLSRTVWEGLLVGIKQNAGAE